MTSPQPSTRDLLARVRAREAVKARLDAASAVDLARYAALCAGVDDSPGGVLAEVVDFGEEDLAATLSWTAHQAKVRIEEAVLLVTRTRDTLAALGAGVSDYPRAVLVAEAVELLEPHQAVTVDTAVAPHLGTDTLPQLRKRVANEVLAAAPAAAAGRHAEGVRRRCVTKRNLADGLAQLVAHGPATQVGAAKEALRRRAERIKARPGETRTRAAIEFDLLVTAGVSDEAARAATAGPDSALVQVTVSLPTLLGLDEAPADLAGYGPITPAVVRDLATRHGSRLRRLVTDPVTGVLVGVDGHTHPGVDPADLAAAVAVAHDLPGRFRWPDDAPAVPATARRGASRRPSAAVPAPSSSSPPTAIDEQPTPEQAATQASAPPSAPAPAATGPDVPSPGRSRTRAGTPDATAPEVTAPEATAPEVTAREAGRVVVPPTVVVTGSGAVVAGAEAGDVGAQPPVTRAHGADRRAIPAPVARFVKARDRHCTVSWCHQPAARCDVDHRTAFPTGPTCPCNLHPLCRRHHRMKQRPGWTVVRDPATGTTTWTTPTGTVRHRPQSPALPVAVVLPDPADLVDQPPDFWIDPRDDPHRRLAPDELTDLTDEDLERLMAEPDLPEDPQTRPPPRILEATGRTSDHRQLPHPGGIRADETRSEHPDLGAPPF